MPPKSQRAAKAADKAKAAQKQKVAEDKTFGLKNKNKSAKVQTYVQQVQTQSKNDAAKNAPVDTRKEKKKLEEQRQKELNELFAQAIKQPKVPIGVDPKSIVCEYFKAGQCTKGFKCKFSHDLNVGRKTQKIDLFQDKREGGEDEEGMEEWDQDKLESVVNQKHGAEKSAHTKTEIICKFFLEAVEKKQYGWFWQCPNGGKDCKYRHALPPGYVLKSQMKELLDAEMENKKSIEEEIEEDRRKVEARTPITLNVFMKWREQQKDKRAEEQAGVEAERRKRGNLTGREIFAEEGFLAEDDMGARDDTDYQQHEEGDEFANAKDLSDFARLHQQAAAENVTAGPSTSGQNGTAHDADSSDGQPGPSNANGTTHVSEADAHLFLDDDEDDDESEEEDHGSNDDSDSDDAD